MHSIYFSLDHKKIVTFLGAMTDVSSTNIQDDWKQREVAEIIQVQISKMTDFLNKFHLSTRHRLSLINERIGWCERMLDNVEAIVLPQEN